MKIWTGREIRLAQGVPLRELRDFDKKKFVLEEEVKTEIDKRISKLKEERKKIPSYAFSWNGANRERLEELEEFKKEVMKLKPRRNSGERINKTAKGKLTDWTKTELRNEILARMDALDTTGEEYSNEELLKDYEEAKK